MKSTIEIALNKHLLDLFWNDFPIQEISISCNATSVFRGG